MMTSTQKSALVAATIAAIATAAAAGTAHADPAATQAPEITNLTTEVLPGVQYTSNLADQSVVIDTPFGKLTALGSQFQVQDASGATIAGTSFSTPPLAADETVAGSVSTSETMPASALVNAATPVNAPGSPSPQDRFDQALGAAAGQFALAAGVGGMVGGLTGLTVGCLAGAVTGGTLFTLVSLGTLTVPAALTGCVGGAAMLGAVLSPLGAAALGIPVGIAAFAQMQNKLNAPPAPVSDAAQQGIPAV
ncbi:hypothetical protein APR12_005523 [Nocardia amikacinitolerans]|uniref:hypothetical protein n=1 Tax=Nocardia amikacinitolerans TaxID=756689 RepID=UPI000AB0D234|nr:hypothetical protein [Nocardia amikacinitolerans]MCP2320142.1 hypothetical protein [Nocardia amikacinitolerans]